jgi:acetyl esterase/lipase
MRVMMWTHRMSDGDSSAGGFAYGLLAAVLALTCHLAVAQDATFRTTKDVIFGDPQRPDRALQSLDVYWKDNGKPRPVVIYVHGGGWFFGDKSEVHHKPDFFAAHDMAFISTNYRLRAEYEVYDQLEDIAAVVRWVHDNQRTYGLDPSRVVLMGHEAGAHLVSLIGTDPSYLKTVQLSLSDLRGVVAVNTVAFDIEAQMQGSASFVERRRFRLAFGEDPAVWQAASPVTQVAKGANTPGFALIYVAGNDAMVEQAKGFSRALREAAVDVVMIPGNEKTGETIDRELGQPNDAPSLALMAFIHAKM